MTYGDAQAALQLAYDRISSFPSKTAKEVAAKIARFRNNMGGRVVRRGWDFGGNTPGTVSQDEALSASDAAKMKLLADQLDAAALPGGQELDPDLVPDVLDEYGAPLAFAGLGVVILAVIAFLLTMKR
jgi:hypothetical protein